MANRSSSFKQIDVMRAIKGATAAGLEVGEINIKPDGSITLIAKGETPKDGSAAIDKALGLR